MSRPVKRSFTIAGHRTSISLEAAFWEAFKAAAAQEGVPVAKLIARIDAARGASGLSSAVENLAPRLLPQRRAACPRESNSQPGAAGLNSRLPGAMGPPGGSGDLNRRSLVELLALAFCFLWRRRSSSLLSRSSSSTSRSILRMESSCSSAEESMRGSILPSDPTGPL